MSLINLGIVHIGKETDPYKKLHKIFERTRKLIETYKPTEMAIEAPFYGKNVQSMLKLGRAQGVAIAAGMDSGLPVFEYAPKKIKQSITGNGNASKEQVAAMLKNLFKYEENPKYLDATDALSVAVCHHFQSGSKLSGDSNYKGWGAFIKANPDRAKG